MSKPARRWRIGSGPRWRLPAHLAALLPAEQRVTASILARRNLLPFPRLNYYLECLCHGGRYRPGRDLLGMLLRDSVVSRDEANAIRSEAGQAAKPFTLGNYELLAKVGEGGMGGVYAAIDRRTGKRFAVKVLRKSLARKPAFLKRFFREAQAALALRHPNIVTGADVGEAEGFHYFVMEFVEGKDCDELVRVNGPFEPYEALRIAREVTKALEYAHAHGFVHRDVKPANIIAAGDGQVKLADFGLVKDMAGDSRLTQGGMAMGTPHFISPEQAVANGKVDRRSDLYSLGATLYFLLTGQPPFDGATPTEVAGKQMRSRPAPLSKHVSGVPKIVERLVQALMVKSPAGRYQHAGDLRSDIEAILAGREPRRMPARSRLPMRADRPVTPLRAMLAGAVLGSALILAALAGYFVFLEQRLPGVLAALRRLATALAQTILPYLGR